MLCVLDGFHTKSLKSVVNSQTEFRNWHLGQNGLVLGSLKGRWSYFHCRDFAPETVWREKMEGGKWGGGRLSVLSHPSLDFLFVCQMYFASHPRHFNGAEHVNIWASLATESPSPLRSPVFVQSLEFMSTSFGSASWSMLSGISGTYVSYYCLEFSMYSAELFWGDLGSVNF